MAELKWYGDKALDRAMQAAVRTVQKCAADLQRESVKQAPIDSGDLRSNCSISLVQKEGKMIWVKVGYDLPYAVIQHERLDFYHPKGGKAKYLEDPFNDNARKYEREIADEVRKALERG